MSDELLTGPELRGPLALAPSSTLSSISDKSTLLSRSDSGDDLSLCSPDHRPLVGVLVASLIATSPWGLLLSIELEIRVVGSSIGVGDLLLMAL